MAIELIVAFVVLLFTLSLLAEPLAQRLRLPQPVLLVVVGTLVGPAAERLLGQPLGVRTLEFHDLVFYVFLPALVFEAAFTISLRELRSNLLVIGFLAVAGVLFTTGVSAALLYLGLGGASGLPWIAVLLAAAVLSATDPVAVISELRAIRAPRRLAMLLEGESLFNDATAIVLFGILLELAAGPTTTVSVNGSVVEFAKVLLGGCALGAVLGTLGAVLMHIDRRPVSHALTTFTAAYGSFLLAQFVLGLSGVLATLVAGLILARTVQKEDAPATGTELGFTWSVLAYAANGSVFLLVGMTLSLRMFAERWGAMLIAVGAVTVARLLLVFGGLGLLNRLLAAPVPRHHQAVMAWGGLRGAVTLALALSLPSTLEYAWTVQAMAFGVVLFTLFVQAPTTPWLMRQVGAATREPTRRSE